MSVFLMQNQPFPITLRATTAPQGNSEDDDDDDDDVEQRNEERYGLKLQLILQNQTLTTTGKRGLPDGNCFSWNVYLSGGSSNVTENVGYSLDFIFIVTPIEGAAWDRLRAKISIHMEGNFRSMLEHCVGERKVEFDSSQVNLRVAFDFPEGPVVQSFHVLGAGRPQQHYEWGHHFFTETEMTEEFALRIIRSVNRPISAKFTIWLSSTFEGATTSQLPIQDDARTRNLNKKLLQEKAHWDFVLVAANGFEIRCHKLLLHASSPFFERMFATDCQEMKDGRCKLNLSKEGLKALLEFLYYSEIAKPLESSGVALELLEISHELQIPDLEATMKQLIIANRDDDDWMDFDGALQLFLRCTKLDLGGYDEIKKKAVKVIKMKKDALKTSAAFDELMESNPKFAKEFLTYFI